MKQLSTAVAAALAGSLLMAASPVALAQPIYPTRPIRIIVPTSPPGGADIVARSIAQPLSERLGQQVIVDNRAGASTMPGGELAAKAPPDGYTLIIGISTLAINLPSPKQAFRATNLCSGTGCLRRQARRRKSSRG